MGTPLWRPGLPCKDARSPPCRLWGTVHNLDGYSSCFALEVDRIYCPALHSCQLWG